jgi:hypothetical protein
MTATTWSKVKAARRVAGSFENVSFQAWVRLPYRSILHIRPKERDHYYYMCEFIDRIKSNEI